MGYISFEEVENNNEILSLIEGSKKVLDAMSYTEHGIRHAKYVSITAYNILSSLGYDERICNLARIAGYIHDVGNTVNRINHGVTGSVLVYPVLRDIGMDIQDITTVLAAVGNHEEETGAIVNEVSAALVIADKSDAHRTRVNRFGFDRKDIHDRVNFAIKKNMVEVDNESKCITAKYYMDNTSSVMEFLNIYLKRMTMSETAAKFLGCRFMLMINDFVINRQL